MAADSRAYGGSWQASPGTKAKIHNVEGVRFGVTSAKVGQPEQFMDWARSAKGATELTGELNFRAMMIDEEGRVFLFDSSPWASGPIDCEFYAIGSGADFAMGAMAMGASAEEAVRIACQLDPHCGLPVTVLS
jgi:hypothetical protein